MRPQGQAKVRTTPTHQIMYSLSSAANTSPVLFLGQLPCHLSVEVVIEEPLGIVKHRPVVDATVLPDERKRQFDAENIPRGSIAREMHCFPLYISIPGSRVSMYRS